MFAFCDTGSLPFTLYREDYVDRVSIFDMSMNVTNQNYNQNQPHAQTQTQTEDQNQSTPSRFVSAATQAPYIGRTYRYLQEQPLWPFGFGLSYTSFAVQAKTDGNLTLPSSTLCPSTSATVPKVSANQGSLSVEVSNIGKVAGAKAVLAFVAPTEVPSLDGEVFATRTLWGAIKSPVLDPGTFAEATFVFGNTLTNTLDCPFCTVDSAGIRGVRAGTYLLSFGGHAGNIFPPSSSASGSESEPRARARARQQPPRVPDSEVSRVYVTVTGDTVVCPL